MGNLLYKIARWLDLNEPKEMKLRAFFLSFMILLGICISVSILSFFNLILATFFSDMQLVFKSAILFVFGISGLDICNKISAYGKENLEFERLGNLMDSMYAISDEKVEQMLKKITSVEDLWEKDLLQKEIASYLKEKPELINMYWKHLDGRTKYFLERK